MNHGTGEALPKQSRTRWSGPSRVCRKKYRGYRGGKNKSARIVHEGSIDCDGGKEWKKKCAREQGSAAVLLVLSRGLIWAAELHNSTDWGEHKMKE